MRIRTATAAVVGALALGGLLAPSAVADTTIAPTIDKASASSLVFSTSGSKTWTVTVTVSDDSGIKGVTFLPWIAADEAQYGTPTASDTSSSGTDLSCTASSATTSTCTYSETIDVQQDLADNYAAGAWHDALLVTGNDGGTTYNAKADTYSFKRQAALTVNASPEPVKKGGTVTVTGKLTRASWDDFAYHGYTNKSVQLQFRKYGSTTYTTVKTVTSDSYGNLKTTATQNEAGYWRYNFAGSSTTSTAKATGDYVAIG